MRKIADNKTVAEAVRLLEENDSKRIALCGATIHHLGYGFYLPGRHNTGNVFHVEDMAEGIKRSMDSHEFTIDELTKPVFTIWEEQ